MNFLDYQRSCRPDEDIFCAVEGVTLPDENISYPQQWWQGQLAAAMNNDIESFKADEGECNIKGGNPKFCQQCNNLSTSHVPDGLRPTIMGALDDYEASAFKGCGVCKLIIEAVKPYEKPGILKGYVRPGAALRLHITSHDKLARYELFTEIGGQHSSWFGIGRARIIAKSSYDDSIVELIQRWVNDCKAHDACQIVKESVLPTRVLNIRANQIRLEETLGRKGTYVALSHCWGKGYIPRTISLTLDGFKKKIPWSVLTKTFQDAIILTRRLGIDYIWIDSLCIIQDNEADWKLEAARMAAIYESAELVVSAALAKDGSRGLFAERSPAPVVSFDRSGGSLIMLPHGTTRHIHSACESVSPSVDYIVRDIPMHAQWDPMELIALNTTEINPLLERAWAFQERLLATRIVHFTEHELIWECKKSQRCECMYLDRSDARPKLAREPHNIKLEYSHVVAAAQQSSPHIDPYLLWAKVVETYTARKLTYEKDRFPALAGAATKMQQLGIGRYVAGIFVRDIPRSLLWHVDDPGIRHPNRTTAPTWSWASVASTEGEGEPPFIKYDWHQYTPMQDYYPYEIEEVCAVCLGVSVMAFLAEGLQVIDTLYPADDATQLEPSQTSQEQQKVYVLMLLGPCLRVSLEIERFSEPKPLFEDRKGVVRMRDFEYRVSMNGKSSRFQSDLFLHLGPDELEVGSELMLMFIGQRVKEAKPDNLIVLRKASKAGEPEFYERIGVICELDEEAKDWWDDIEVKVVSII